MHFIAYLDPFFNEIEDQIKMSQKITSHYPSGKEIPFSEFEKAPVPVNRRPADQNFWDEKNQTKQFTKRF